MSKLSQHSTYQHKVQTMSKKPKQKSKQKFSSRNEYDDDYSQGKGKKKKLNTRNESSESAQKLGSRKKFDQHDLCSFKPRTLNQEKFVGLYHRGFPLISLVGCAGTGKSYIAMWMALNEIFDPSTPYKRLIIVRSAVETRTQGHLPGALDGPEGKNAPFEIPYRQITQKIIPNFKDGYEHLKALGYIEFMTTGHIRGQTYDDAIILIEEIQNTDWDEALSILTRAGENSKILITGDHRQNDLKRKRQESGFDRMRRVFANIPDDEYQYGEVVFEPSDVVRSGIVKSIIIADHITK